MWNQGKLPFLPAQRPFAWHYLQALPPVADEYHEEQINYLNLGEGLYWLWVIGTVLNLGTSDTPFDKPWPTLKSQKNIRRIHQEDDYRLELEESEESGYRPEPHQRLGITQLRIVQAMSRLLSRINTYAFP
ncbi:MAG TPA: hypothetical protein DD706_21180 [Nitrospiraceae bacterium]|nr:hypothetical protein [Nitrospiraceae bacterium]